MALTADEREKIYLEEKSRREGSGIAPTTVFVLSSLAFLGLVGIFYLSRKLEEKQVSLEDLRKAYPGLTPEEQE